MSLNLFCIWIIIGVLKLVNGKGITGFTNSSGEYFIISHSKYDTFQFDTIKCSNNINDCYVICDVYNGCYNTQIYAESISNLYLQCLSERACDTAQIVSSPNSNLYAKCDQVSSCNELKVNASKTNNNVFLECSSTSSCYKVQINTKQSNQISLKCNGRNTCYGINLIGPQTKPTSIANIECFGSTSCQNAVFNLTNTNLINLKCKEGACYYGSFYAYYSNMISITCSAYGDSACHGGDYYVNSTGLTLHCYGYGCYNLGELHIMNKNISSASIYMNGCGQCNATNDCINSWSIYCSDSVTFYGDHCSYSNYCGCNAEVIEIQNNFVNDNSHSLCPIYPTYPTYPTPKPIYTTYPTYPEYPTPSPTYSTNHRSSTSPLTIIAPVLGVIIIIGLFAWLIIAATKKKNNGKRRIMVKEDEEEKEIMGGNNKNKNNNKNNNKEQREVSQVEGVNDYEVIIPSQEGMEQPMLNEADVNEVEIVN